MASSAQEHLQTLASYGAMTAPPPTPATEPNRHSSSNAADALSRLLHRLPPTLSLPSRLSRPITSPPIVSSINSDEILSSSSEFGFFQLTNHSIPSQLALAAELESLSLFNLPDEQKQKLFPRNWPLGFDEEDEDDGDGNGVSLCLSADSPTESTEFNLSSLIQFIQSLEKLGLEIVEALSQALQFENPLRQTEETKRSQSHPWSSLVWISECVAGNKSVINGRLYPYIVALQYQIRRRKLSLLSDSGWISVSPEVDSVLVTIGDIAQVWSNGKLKKVRGTAVASSGDEDKLQCISLTLLVTLPMESSVSPLLPLALTVLKDGDNEHDQTNGEGEKELRKRTHHQQEEGVIETETEIETEKRALFQSFSFEDYAWRIYHERLLFKDPLDRYRLT